MTDHPDPLPSTWIARDRPIGAAALRRLDAGEDFVSLEEIRADMGLDVTQMRAGLGALEAASPPYLSVQLLGSGPAQVGGFVESVSERARRELGTWPSSTGLLDALVAALDQAGEADPDPEPERRSRLKAAAGVLAGMAKEVAVGVIANQLGGL